MSNKKMKFPDAGHGQHLCYLVNMRFNESNLPEYMDLVRDAEYVCKNCGRTAEDKKSLCKPVRL